MDSVTQQVRNYLSDLSSAYARLPLERVIELAHKIVSIRETGTVFIIGNGGSASTASHMAIDLGVGLLRHKNHVPVISLADNSGVITATGNDLDFESIFSRQILLLGRQKDMLICISASGNSENIIEAVLCAKEKGMYTVGITGFDGGKISQLCDYSIHIPTKSGQYGIVEDVHLSIGHMLTEVVKNL